MFGTSFNELSPWAQWFIIGVFVLVGITILFSLVKAIRDWKYNQSQPILTVAARVVAKKADVTRGIRPNLARIEHDKFMARYAQTVKYYLAFILEDGQQLKFRVKRKEFDRIEKEDAGKLTYQGTRFLGFKP